LSARRWISVVVLTCSFLLLTQQSHAQIYVDACASGFFENGTLLFPYKTLAKAVEHANAFPGSNIIMKGGVYPEALTISDPLTMTAYDGSALIGGYSVGWRDVILELSSGQFTNARVYYPAWSGGQNTQIASPCEGGFPGIVYAHGKRVSDNLCSWCDDALRTDITKDYLQAEGILARLASSGIISISFNWHGLTIHYHWWEPSKDHIAQYVIDAITYLGNEFGDDIDMKHAGLIGHSTGGAAVIKAAEILSIDRNPPALIKGVGLIAPSYPFMQSNLNPIGPVLVINGTREHPCQVGLQPLEIYCEAAPPKHLVYVTGANHFGYTDGICLEPNPPEEGECTSTNIIDPYELNPRDYLIAAPGWDNGSEVGGKTGQEAQALQQLAAGNYLLAFFSYYLQNDTNTIDYLIQQEGKRCGYPGSPEHCQGDLMVSPPSDCVPIRYFDDLQSLNVGVNVSSCLK